MKQESAVAVRDFVGRINEHDVEGLARLMTDDHVFIDSLGQSTSGRTVVGEAWEGYFQSMPDYSVEIEEIILRGNVAVMFGTAVGTYSVGGRLMAVNRWKVPACWRAVVRDGKVAEWRIYADNKPVYDIMARNP